MTVVSPFRGWRYNPDTVGDMASVLCPPYDMITPENQESLKRQNQYNVIHLEAGEGLDWNVSAKEQYAATSGLFDRWMKEEVLRQDQEPCYYLMRHSFNLGGKNMVRLGLIASVGLEDYQTRQVLPHEFTEAPANSRPCITDGVVVSQYQPHHVAVPRRRRRAGRSVQTGDERNARDRRQKMTQGARQPCGASPIVACRVR